MNKRQKLVQEAFLDNEEAVIKRLKTVYNKSLEDITAKSKVLQDQINSIAAQIDLTDDEVEKAVLKSMEQSKIYQKQYQDALKTQISSVLDNMQVEEFQTVSDYLKTCYEDGFVGTLYDLQGQGIPLAFPLDQEAMVTAVQLDSKISKGLYTRLGEDVSVLKKKITAQVSRGIATGMTWKQVANQLAGYTKIGYNNAVRIARTEGHRIQNQGAMNACHSAKEKGADVVKQWDSTLDAKTRDSHVMVDGEIRELDEPFSNGLMFPGDPDGGAAEVCNCRCALLQRARWAVGGGFTKMNNITKQLETFESPEDYAEFKKSFFSKENRQYMNYVQEMEDKYQTRDFRMVLDKMDDKEYDKYSKLLGSNPLYNKGATNGLAAKIGGNGVPEHEEPVLLKKIDHKDKKKIMEELTNFEKSAINESIEKACVITKAGEVFICSGTEDQVFPDSDLGEKLFGATVSHNHLITKTDYTFSDADMFLFEEYKLDVLRGCDKKYTYEFTRNAKDIDKSDEEWQSHEAFRHNVMIENAKAMGFGYRRWKNG